MLVSMGFDGNNARQALVRARNDINVATNILLEAQSHWTNALQLSGGKLEGRTGYIPRWTNNMSTLDYRSVD
jgi:hypothetical protein